MIIIDDEEEEEEEEDDEADVDDEDVNDDTGLLWRLGQCPGQPCVESQPDFPGVTLTTSLRSYALWLIHI